MKFRQIIESIYLNEGEGRPRAKTVNHKNEDKELDLDAFKKDAGKKISIKNQHIKGKQYSRYKITDGPLAGAFITDEPDPPGKSKYKFKNATIVTPSGSDITADTIEKHATKYHKPEKKSKEKDSEMDFRTLLDDENKPVKKNGKNVVYPIGMKKK